MSVIALAVLVASGLQDVRQDPLDRWVEAWSTVPSSRVAWDCPRRIRDGPSTDAGIALEYVVREEAVFRWPDAVRRDRSMLDQSGNALDPRTPIHRAAIDLDGATEAHLAGHGSVSLSTLTPTYQSWSAVTTLADDAPYFGVESPAVLACWISSHPEIEIKSTGQPDTYVIPLERAVVVRLVDHNGKPTISMIEFLSKDDQPVRRIEFSEFTEIPGLPGPVGRVRVNSRRSSGQAELQETSKDRLVFMEAVATPDDSYFQLDLTGRTTVDAASGEIRNETGTVVGKVSARRAIGHVQQWAVLVVCAGVGLSVGGLVIAWKRSQS